MSVNKDRCKNKLGVTLLEILISLMILALALLPTVGTFSTYYGTATRQVEQETALKIAEAVANQLHTLSYGLLLDNSTPIDIPLNIETPEGSAIGTLKIIDWNGESEDIRINRINYKIEVKIKKIFKSQDLSQPHNESMEFAFLELNNLIPPVSANSLNIAKCDSFDEGLIFNVTVKFGNAVPIRLTSFRTDMVK